MRILLLTIYFLYLGNSLIPPRKAFGVVPFYYLPSNNNLKIGSLEIAKSAYQLLIYGQKEESLRLAKLAISLNNKFSEAYNNLANTQKKIGDNENAENNYIQAIKSNKSNYGAFFNLANLYRSEKKFEKAIDNYKKVLELNPQFVESMNNIGSINLILGNFENGIKYFKEAIEIDKFNSESYYNYVSAKKILENDEIFIKLKNLVEEEKLPEVQNFKMSKKCLPAF